jgi:antitoxin component YwqK of YwqJK toxin-antitoxin module
MVNCYVKKTYAKMNTNVRTECFVINDIKEGPSKVFHDGGMLKRIYYFINNKKHGEFREYYRCGQLAEICTYVNDLREGENIVYHRDGQVFILCNYLHNRLHGKYEEYYDNGQLCEICTYDNGKKNGERKRYFRDGSLEMYEMRNNSKLVNGIQYWPSGQIFKTY